MGAGKNRPDPVKGIWTVQSKDPLADADRLLAGFLPRAFRRPVDAATRKHHVDQVAKRLQAGDCFETAMRWVYRAALCSPDFLYHVEPAGKLDYHALACRLSYFFWRSMPDDKLTRLVDEGRLSPAAAANHPQRPLIMRALQGSTEAEPDLAIHEAMLGDRYLLCSDGLTDVVSDEDVH